MRQKPFTMLSQKKNIPRKVAFVACLILMLILIYLRFLQQTKLCRRVEEGQLISLEIESENNPRVFNSWTVRHHNNTRIEIVDKNVDLSVLNQGSRAVVTSRVAEIYPKYDKKPKVQAEVSPGKEGRRIEPQYNSIEGKFFDKIFINHIDQLISKRECKIRLINTTIHPLGDSRPSVLTHIISARQKIRLIRLEIFTQFYRLLPASHADLATGVLLGSDNLTPSLEKQTFIKAGVLHVVAASGYNVSVVIGLVGMNLRKFFRFRLVILISGLVIIGYVILAGESVSVIRAGLMALLALTAKFHGRMINGIWILMWCVLIMALWDPLVIFSVSLWLSVAATLGLLCGLPKYEGLEIDQQSTEGGSKNIASIMQVLVENFQTTFAASIFTTPILVIVFGQLSLVSIVANTLLLWLIPYLMLFAATLAIFSLLNFPMTKMLAVLVYVVSEMFLQGARLAASLPKAAITLDESEEKLGILIIWLALVWYFIKFRHKVADDE